MTTPKAQADASAMSRRQLRGSMLLLSGRGGAVLLATAAQVVVVRALTKQEYGAFAYAFVLVLAGRSVLSLGQGKMLSRFMAKYEEEHDYARMFGTMLMAVATIAFTSTLAIAGVLVFRDQLASSAIDNPTAVAVLAILIFLAPLEALDQVFVSLFAVFSRPRSIVFRKYLLTPVLRLIVVVLLVVLHQDAVFLATGYLVTGLIGLAVYLLLLDRVLRERGLRSHLRINRLVVPFRPVLSFTIPTMTGDLVFLSTTAGSVLLLGKFGGVTEVAGYRAVFPAAHLNQFIFASFVTLFLPMAARLAARNDLPGLKVAYWHTAYMLAVLSFPIFAMTVPFAHATTVALFGERYAGSATVLALLSTGYAVNSALGFNAYTLQVLGKLRFIVWANIGAALFNLVLSAAVAASWGAIGIAVANCSTMIGLNLANQAVLARSLRSGLVDRSYLLPYVRLLVCVAALVAVELIFHPGLLVAIAVTALVGLVLLRISRRDLRLSETFPEVTRIPLVGRLIS